MIALKENVRHSAYFGLAYITKKKRNYSRVIYQHYFPMEGEYTLSNIFSVFYPHSLPSYIFLVRRHDTRIGETFKQGLNGYIYGTILKK